MTPLETPSPAPPRLRPKVTAGIVVRSLIFTAWLYGVGAVMLIGSLPLLWGPRRRVVAAARVWSRLVIGGLERIVGARVEVRGREHLPAGPCLIPAKHQTMFDFIPPFVFLDDPCFVMKQELMRIPLFGWFSDKLEMIVIRRDQAAKALRAMMHDAQDARAEGRQIIIFPEGTRKTPGDPADYKPGVAALYRDLDIPCVPLAANSGVIWPAHGLIRYPGTVVFEFLPPIPPGLKRASFMAVLEDAVEEASARLLEEARA